MFGFSGMEWDMLVWYNVVVVLVIGNNGIWGLEKYLMEVLYGYLVVVELCLGICYDEVVCVLGGYGELVLVFVEFWLVLEWVFVSGLFVVVNVFIDLSVVYLC